MSTGALFIIGGAEAKEGERPILSEFTARVDGGRVVLATIASREPEGYVEAYRSAFEGLPVGEIVPLYVEDRAQAYDQARMNPLEDAAGIFFTGGDQQRIMSQIGGTPLEERIRELWHAGTAVAGTSAGAAVMSDTMLVSGPGDASPRVGDLRMASGLGLVRGVVIDQHFAERGRMGRLLGAVAQSPSTLGIGIDEDTAILVEDERLRVIGAGAVYLLDGSAIADSNAATAPDGTILSLRDVQLHVLAPGDTWLLPSGDDGERSGR